ncbi:MAG TPA: GatB/YqeY domain-containing protein [Draconibacterium sp.]|nr:GatB/YqeY domain-containing protein [Draconibacterium sp.]HRX11291.1 GatB/YqeY domain-containing protein [Draconibacterium sp.]
MTLSDKINDEIKEAMKAREKEKLEALRSIKKVIIEAKSTKGAGSELDDDEVLKIIAKLAKQGSESAAIYKQQGRTDLYEQEMSQVAVFENYLPAKLSDEELTEKIKAIIAELGVTSIKEMGKVIGAASKKLSGLADGKDISAKVKEILQ